MSANGFVILLFSRDDEVIDARYYDSPYAVDASSLAESYVRESKRAVSFQIWSGGRKITEGSPREFTPSPILAS